MTDIVVEDLSVTGCRILIDEEIAPGTTVGIGVPGIGMQAARIVRSNGNVHGCAFLLPITEEEIAEALSAITIEEVAFPKLRERIRTEAGIKYDRRAMDRPKQSFGKRLLSRFR